MSNLCGPAPARPPVITRFPSPVINRCCPVILPPPFSTQLIAVFTEPLTLPPPCAFLAPLRIAPAPDHPEILLAEQRFDNLSFEPALFHQLGIARPDAVARSVVKRQAEFLASRYALRQLLTRFGVSGFQLGNDSDRVPVWPAGVKGSLTHSVQRAAMAICPATSGYQPGIDCEMLLTPARADALHSAIIQPQEHALLSQSSLPFASALTLAFSMKESLYKALYPRFRQFMGFHSASIVALSDDGSQATLRLNQGLENGPAAGSCFSARAWFTPGEVLTFVVSENR